MLLCQNVNELEAQWQLWVSTDMMLALVLIKYFVAR